jgi:hypothetical protein
MEKIEELEKVLKLTKGINIDYSSSDNKFTLDFSEDGMQLTIKNVFLGEGLNELFRLYELLNSPTVKYVMKERS